MLAVMKCVVVLLAFVSLAWGQEQHCHCASIITTEEGAGLAYDLPPTEVQDCNNLEACELRCIDEYTVLTNDGDLDFVLENGETVGQVACNTLKPQGYDDVGPLEVFLYYNLCLGPWYYTGFKSQQKLCCVGGEHTPC
ncbi:uncharacterized protein LOC121871932 [Homarus americanus]|uniref:uncharacterized protein LOC121871932 n=1 Tax=Homarus americanus TaxID=6706 RepID=UPI001C482DEF|nr:uncharacterized protein LOC121871932 [Homarus americanus]XP_042230466.1 uncharacterized protein LOC121871932 [Homarus americanus]